MQMAIEIKGLHKTYNNGFVALKGIDLDIKQGDFFALLGPNGAGKSTTIGILSTLVVKTKGSVKIMGHDLDKEPSKAKLSLGVVPQEFNFNQFESVYDIVMCQAGFYGVSEEDAKPRIETYLKKLDLWGKRHERSRNLSGGMKRRLMIARALIHDPSILILDEPTAGVDVELRHTTWEFLKYINEEKKVTIILTTHYLEEAENLCKGIAIIDKGEIIENTTVKNLINRINVHTLKLELAAPITEVPVLKSGVAKLIDDTTLEVNTTPGVTINELFDELSSKSIEVLSLGQSQSRLETLFMTMTNSAKTSE